MHLARQRDVRTKRFDVGGESCIDHGRRETFREIARRRRSGVLARRGAPRPLAFTGLGFESTMQTSDGVRVQRFPTRLYPK